MKIFLKKICTFIIDIIFPIACISCGKDDIWFCPECFGKINFMKHQRCPVCNIISDNGKTCPSCKNQTYLSGISISAHYKDDLLQKIIHAFKYKYVKDLSKTLGSFLIKTVPENFISNSKNCFLVPVPLHKKRERERGFNQALLLAQIVAHKTGIQIQSDLLKRTRHTKSQMKLEAEERKTNVSDAFEVISNLDLRGKTAILIDDVCTTGATLEECAKVLKANNIKSVWAIVLARGR